MDKPHQNILLFSIEDLNDWIEPLGGHPDAITPNLSRLAKRAAVFTQAYSPAPACSPARTAALFGQNPWETGVYENKHKWHHHYAKGKRLSLIGRMRSAGFETHGLGKVFHVNKPQFDYEDWDSFPQSNSELFPPISRLAKTGKFGPSIDFGAIPDGDDLYDDANTSAMIARMERGSQGQFWALGLYRPHLPFVVPQRFFDMLPDTVANPPGLGQNSFDPTAEAPQSGLSAAGKAYANSRAQFRRIVSRTGEYQDFLKAYLASVAYADYLLGRVLDHMDDAGLWENTTLLLWSDHGYQLGEKLAFHKFTLWERSLRVPLMIAGPQIAAGRYDEPVSLIDIAPTLMAVAGQPPVPQFSGQNLLPLLKGETAAMRGYAGSVWTQQSKEGLAQTALSLRSATHRYIFYWDGSEELYDHQRDPFEHDNLLAGGTGNARALALREEFMALLPEDMAEPAN
ncbi:sulfatase [Neptunicoccus sediminis]|uniref:sulfatase n=1 Tax=Neptunicoccus sediminis TaxID=1892596 RepID=UPI000845F348|nr:sulfatase [Neptunicoccus sediminis]